MRNWRNCLNIVAGSLHFASTSTNITTTLAGSVAFLTVGGCDAGYRPFFFRCRRNECSRSPFGHDIYDIKIY